MAMKVTYQIEKCYVPSDHHSDWTRFMGNGDIATLAEARKRVRDDQAYHVKQGYSSKLHIRIVKITEKVVR